MGNNDDEFPIDLLMATNGKLAPHLLPFLDPLANLMAEQELALARARGDHVTEIQDMIAPARQTTAFAGMFLWTLLKGYSAGAPSPGYEPILVRAGVPTTVARAMAKLVVAHGRRRASEIERQAQTVRDIRYLAQSQRRRPALSRIHALLRTWHETSILEDAIFVKQDVTMREFARLLGLATTGDDAAFQRVQAIARAQLPHLPNVRGRNMTAASAAHEFALEGFPKILGPITITVDGTDCLTEATRREFGLRNFDPRPAHRRLKAQMRAQAR